MKQPPFNLREHLRRYRAAYCVLIFCLTASLSAFYFIRQEQARQREAARFQAAAFAAFHSAGFHLEHHVNLIFGARGLFLAREDVDLAAWQRYFKTFDLSASYPGALDIGYVKRVEEGERAAHTESIRRQGAPNYQIVAAPPQGTAYPVIYLLDRDRGHQIPQGWDAHSDPVRRAVMERARDSGEALATGKTLLHTAARGANEVEGFIVYLPIYKGSISPETLDERRRLIEGFVFVSIRPEAAWLKSGAEDGKRMVDFAVYDTTEPSSPQLLYASDPAAARLDLASAPSLSTDTMGRTWKFFFLRTKAFQQHSEASILRIELFGRVAMSVCLFSIVFLQTRSRLASARLTAEVVQSERDLRGANQQLHAKIEELQAAKEALRAAHDYSENLIESSLDMIISVDTDGRIAGFNRSAEKTFGYQREEVLQHHSEILYADKETQEITKEILNHTGKFSGEVMNRKKDGSTFISFVSASVLRDSAQNVIGVMGVSRDVTDRKRAEEQLAAEKERLSVTLRSIADGVITTDKQGRVRLINKAGEELTGCPASAAIGRPLHEIFQVVDERTRRPAPNPVDSVLGGGEGAGAPLESVLLSWDGKERFISESAAPIRDAAGKLLGVILVFRDITEHKKLSGELLKASKMESIGLLAGGIAHDFNNILTGILGNISLTKLQGHSDPEMESWLNQAEKACLRAQELTGQLLTFAKGGAPVRKLTNILTLAREAGEFAARGSAVRCEVRGAEDLWAAEVDEGQLAQVFHNLMINALEAMPEGGVASMELSNAELSAATAAPLPAGRYVLINVRDTGMGIRPEHMSRIFEPYFSTKQRGSGLGLATAYSVIKRHGGLLQVESQLGKGTCFTIYLPASDKPAPARVEKEMQITKGAGRVLVMDDEPLIRNLVKAILRKLGYEAEAASEGAEAIQLYQAARAEGRPFVAVIMDLTIPGGMGGKEAVRKLLDFDPEARVIVSSGYSSDPILANYREYGFRGFVSKPFRIQDVAAALDQVLKEAAVSRN